MQLSHDLNKPSTRASFKQHVRQTKRRSKTKLRKKHEEEEANEEEFIETLELEIYESERTFT